MSKLQLILLGHFDCLLSSGERISLAMRKAEVLLAYLALAPGIRHPRERLINLLWSDRGEEQARNSLRQCLSAIRKSLGNSADLILQIDRTTVSLKLDLVDVDALEFEHLATEADFESLSTAAGLYQGEFLEGVSLRDAAGQEWLDGTRSRFKRQYIEILTNLGHTLLASRDYSAAIKSGEHLVEQDPLGESGWRLLMRGYFEHGDRSHALQAFKRCQQALHDELDVDPEAATLELRDQIATGESSPPAEPTPVVGRSSVDTLSPTGHSSLKPPPDFQPSTDHSIAVLPFDNLSGDPEQEYFSDGITDSIILNLSLFPGLNVKSRNSSFAFKQQIKSLGEISQELDVDYVVEGNIRKSRDRIRITVQLIEAATGNQVWGKRYDAEIENLFDLEEELSRTIAATITGQIESELQRIAIAKGAAGQQSYDLLLSGTYHCLRFNRQDTVIAIEKLNQCLAQDPDNVRAHALLYTCHGMDYLERWTRDYQASFQHAEVHIRKALALDPELGQVQVSYAEFLTFSGELDLAAQHLDKAFEINPNDPDALATRALNLEALGEFETALKTAEHACLLDPYHPWAEWELAVSQYLCGQYEAAIETIAKSRTLPVFTRIFVVASNIKLGRIDIAQQALQMFLQACRESMLSMPQSLDEWFSYTRDNYPFTDARINHDILDCLVKAGLEDENSKPAAAVESNEHSIAVLPFDNLSQDSEQEYFSDGITESIILNLSLFPGLQVKSRNSSFAFKQQMKSLGEISQELNVDYIVEGSVRRSSDRIRITLQLIKAASGNQIWGKRYDAEIENLFDLEEELSRSIAATVTGQIESELQRIAITGSAADQQAYDLLLSGNYHLDRGDRNNVAIAIEAFNQCLAKDPDNARVHANLFFCHDMNVMDHWTEDIAQSRELAAGHIHKAVSLEPDLGFVQVAYANYLIYTHQFEQAEHQLKCALDTNPNNTEAIAMLAVNLSIQGKVEAALEKAELALKLDPYHAWAKWIKAESEFFCGRYEDCLATIADTGNAPGFIQIYNVAANIKLSRPDVATQALGYFLRFCNETMASAPDSIDKWREYYQDNAPFIDTACNQEIVDCLLQAGLEDETTPQSASDGADDDLPSIAVLPFENMSDDPEQEYFSDGITTDIISTLSKFNHMRTVARHSTLQYKNQEASIVEIAEQQGVRYILEGSVRKSGNRIRVNAELIDSHSENICWSEHYDRDLDDLFAAQDEMTKSIALAMKAQLDDGDMALQRSTGTTNIKAWQLALAAVDLQDTYIRENILEARTMAMEAIKLDPGYPYAWIALGWTHWQEAYSGWCEAFEIPLAEAEKANQHALGIDPEYAEVWSQAGIIHVMKHEPEQALKACRKAVELEPGNAEIQALMAFSLIFVGDYEQARLHQHNMSKLCPILPNWYYLIGGQIERNLGSLDEAIHLFKQGIDVEPDSPLCRFYQIDAVMEQGDENRAGILADEIRVLDQSVTGKGLVRTVSQDKSIRDRFQAHLAKFDLF